MTAFINELPLRAARRFAELELKGFATNTQIIWLHDNPLLWLRALQVIFKDVENVMAKNRRYLTDLKPPAGLHATQEYIQAKHEMDKKDVGRLHFKGLVSKRVDEVKSLLGSGPVDHLMVGDLIEVFANISMLADGGDLEDAADKAMFWSKKLSGRK